MQTDLKTAGERLMQAAQNGQVETGQWVSLIGGGLLVGFGLSRQSLVGLGLAAIGGRMALKTLQQFADPSLTPPYDRLDSEEPIPANPVDEASWESFPASDAPATY